MRTLGQVSADTRYRLAADAFSTVAAYYAEIAAYLNQIGDNSLPQAPGDGAREGRRPAVRREPAPAGGVLPRDDAPLRHARRRDAAPRLAADVQQPARPRRRLPDRGGLHGPDGGHHQAHRPGRRRVGARSWSRPTGGRWTRTPSRRSAASWASTASWTARPRARSRPTRTRRSSRPASRRRRAGSSSPRPASSCSPCRRRRPRACATTASRTSTSSASAAACSSRRSTPSTSTAASSRSSPGATRPWAS